MQGGRWSKKSQNLVNIVCELCPKYKELFARKIYPLQRVLALCDFWDLKKVALAKNRIRKMTALIKSTRKIYQTIQKPLNYTYMTETTKLFKCIKLLKYIRTLNHLAIQGKRGYH